jgi:hypothetical protein
VPYIVLLPGVATGLSANDEMFAILNAIDFVMS